ncbi:ATP-binding cassette sub-family A member 2-like isoform X2 [Drosophila innubila]|uniref:ATP-binding cassette sub-family A member 2-like isoform X1 n=2 Tax=Drosophila innubila TaxID=198719 RepID=UPI00148B3539|nr:ATP-binding cassette sub-family A member 2-like isoform X1 [Drosophila innubila]XP_034475051.1 ATP-binding cassette sub-family A member 2-like isoform X2 [Drosophila innubila]
MACQCSPLFYVFWRKNWLYLSYNVIPLLIILLGWTAVIFGYLYGSNQSMTSRMEVFETKEDETLKGNLPEFETIYYAPNTDNVNLFMNDLREMLPAENYRGFNSSTEMELDMEQQCRGNCFAIHYQELSDPMTGGRFKYSLSSNRMRISPKKRFVNDEEINHQIDDDEYIREHFLTLQLILDRQYMSYTKVNANYKLLLNSMPYLEVSASDSNRVINFGTLLFILFSVLLLSTFVVPFVEEKQNGLKEYLNLVTPMSYLNGLTFFLIRFVCYSAFLVATMCLAWKYEALGIGCHAYILILYLLYIIANMSYAYLISVCFHSVFYAKIGGLVLLIMPYVFSFVRNWLTKVSFYLFCTNSFLEGLDILQTFSNKHRQFTGADLFRVIKDDVGCLFCVYAVLIFQTVLYAVLYNYFVCVFPGPGGLKRPFLFFLNPETYKKRQRNEYTTSPRGTHAIIISDLCKIFRTSKRETHIADHLNMTINNKEITVLLGHNGAGKTTMMNMIMGLVPKDSGKICVCSERDVASYRHLIGFCPQHSVFMSYMTCHQHLEFFAQLRGATRSDARQWAEEKLQKLNLSDKANEYGEKLSGGMKRRLSLGIAIAGNTKIVILDEPSSGLDIESRRELWDILLALRKDKAILVTTHYMEEAEVLGDTICILANGKLQANGSPLELKRKLGSGYRLKLEAHETKFQEQKTLDMIRGFIPNARVQNIVKPTINICLPYDYQLKFHDMLRSLEANMVDLGIETISITDTSLETVFLNCAGEIDQVDTPDIGTRNDAPLLATPYKRLQHNTPHWWQLWAAIFYKKFTFLFNEWTYACCMLSLPLICVTGVILQMHSMSIVTNEASLSLNLRQMRTGNVYIYNPTGRHATVEQKLRQFIKHSGLNAKTLTPRASELSDNSTRQELLQLQRDNLADFLEDTIGLVDMYADGRGEGDTPTLSIYYAGNRYHSSVILVNMVDTCMLQLSSFQSDTSIDTTYVPIKRFITDVSISRLEYYVVFVSAAMFFSMFYYISLPFRENSSGFRQLQPMSRYTYWFSTFVFDIILHGMLCVALFLIQQLIMPAELYKIEDLQMIVFSIFFYGCSYLPILYTLGNSFKSISTISTYLLLMFIVSEIAPLITSNNISAMKQHSTKIVFLCFLPDFNLNHHLRVINENFISRNRKLRESSIIGKEDTSTFFVYAIFVCVFVMGFFVIVLEHKYYRKRLRDFFQGKTCKVPPKSGSRTGISTQLSLDCLDDCTRESERAKQLSGEERCAAQDYPLIVSNLRKSYAGKAAVNGLGFAVERGECFGLLGVNGAGKTSTFQMIAANLVIDTGCIQIDGIDIQQNEVAYRQRFGYCPQYDALNKFMTAEQCLRYMALLRGLVASKDDPAGVEFNVHFWLQKMHLLKYRNVQVRYYSGGTKRKLLAAMAMIGAPSLVLLDEPTTGVDPISRRFLWQCIKDFQDKDRTVVLTSHSMDECEELCNRLAIMADGKFKCLNNICALKRLSGFTIKLKMNIDTETENNVMTITNTLKDLFKDLDLRESHAGTLTYFVKTEEHIIWSNVFKITKDYLEGELGDLVEYYSVNECTLEDIFLKFDKQKSSPRAGSINYV